MFIDIQPDQPLIYKLWKNELKLTAYIKAAATAVHIRINCCYQHQEQQQNRSKTTFSPIIDISCCSREDVVINR